MALPNPFQNTFNAVPPDQVKHNKSSLDVNGRLAHELEI